MSLPYGRRASEHGAHFHNSGMLSFRFSRWPRAQDGLLCIWRSVTEAGAAATGADATCVGLKAVGPLIVDIDVASLATGRSSETSAEFEVVAAGFGGLKSATLKTSSKMNCWTGRSLVNLEIS